MQLASITTASSVSADSASAATEETLGKDAFLRLLITQIRYQDPLSPLDDREFIAQLAQFSSLEQMQEMNAGLGTVQQMSATTQALSLVGRQITAQDPDTSDQIVGTVEAVSFRSGAPVLVVSGREVELSWVAQVR
jgi:flagellar basal-body rod modification protein FlgD